MRVHFPAAAIAAACYAVTAAPSPSLADQSVTPLVTGKLLTPEGQQTNIGSFPDNLALSPDGKFVVVTNTGSREYLSVLRVADGTLVSQLDFNGPSDILDRKKQALYYGLAFGKTVDGLTSLYASRGGEGIVSVLTLDSDGNLKDTGKTLTLLSAADADAPPTTA
jgi:hypothetical protein